VIELVVPHHLVRDYGPRIEEAGKGRVRLIPVSGGSPDDPDISQAEAVVFGDFDGPWSFAELLSRMPNLRWIHSLSAGVDAFVSPDLDARGCTLTNSRGIYAPAMAEYAVAGMVMLARGMPRYLEDQRDHVWRPAFVGSGPELYGSRVSILGYGEVGRYIGRICRSLGMEVWASRRSAGLPIGEPVDRLLSADAVDELLDGATFLVICAPLTEATRGAIGARELRRLAPGAVVVNVARGGIVDESALAEALTDGHLAGAMVDVTETEPTPSDSPLWDAPNLWLTPHISGNTHACWERSIELLCANLAQYAAGQPQRMANLVEISAQL
jgi:phosphoglycerate dehydrogenase-like enzyme